MPPTELEGDTLGEKHKHFNKLVRDAVAQGQINISDIDYNDNDIDNLLKIHIACRTKNVEYIIETLKCEDMLYVSTVIKQSTWLITDQKYSHIVNPEYLHTHLFPHMLTKAINKLLLHIRLNLKDEKRVETFYNYFKDAIDDTEAKKWLLNCSMTFIENLLQNDLHISCEIYKRLCKRSIKFLPYYNKVKGRCEINSLQKVSFLIIPHTENFLNVLDTVNDNYHIPTFDKKQTKVIMEKCPERIFNNLKKYIDNVDLSVVVKCIKQEETKNFLLKHAKDKDIRHYFSNYKNLKLFIKNMPKQDRFDFVKKVYIDKIEDETTTCAPTCSVNTYQWYQFAPFHVALQELNTLIRAESSSAERCAMLSVLITCVTTSTQHARTLIRYYYDNHRNEPFKFKIQFVNNVITKMRIHEFDSETWNILNKLFHSLEVYIESSNDVQLCLQSIIVYKVLHNENIPDIIKTKIKFDTFGLFQNKLNETQRNQLFSYLITSILNNLNNKSIKSELDLENYINLLHNAMDLIKCWKKDITDYNVILLKIQEIIKVKKQNSWTTNLSSLYVSNKSWRRYLFAESLMLSPNEEVCLNALKHKPQLLEQHKEEVEALRTDSTVDLRRLLNKLRVYWTHSLAQQWSDAYMNNIDQSTGHNALFKGLFVLLPRKPLIELVEKYVPNNTRIDWCEINEAELSISKNIAKSLFIARPIISLDVVASYAKGDYLQYAVSSLNAILYNISQVQSRLHISKLLEAPVSLQKYGLKLAYSKLKEDEIRHLFLDIWHTTNNLTIRRHLFVYTYELLCKEKDPTLARGLWEVLRKFMSTLTANENKDIYTKLGDVEKVHIAIRGEFFMQSFAFLSSLPPSVNCANEKSTLLCYAPTIIDLLDNDFVTQTLLASIETKISSPNSEFINIISSYVLQGNTQDEQCEKYKKVVVPVLEHAISSWDLVTHHLYTMKYNVDALLKALTWDAIRFLTVKKIVVPIKLFSKLTNFIEQKMPKADNYIRYTSWKLIAEYVKLVAEHQQMLCDIRLNKILLEDLSCDWMPNEGKDVWQDLHFKLSPKFASIIVNHLKEDMQKYFSSICWLFSSALNTTFSYICLYSYNCGTIMKMETLKHMVLNEDYIPSFLVVCEETPKYSIYSDEEIKKQSEIRKILSTHSSQEVQMHYQKAFADIPLKF